VVSQAQAPSQTPALISDLTSLVKAGRLKVTTLRTFTPNAAGVAVKPNEQAITVQGTVNKVPNTSLSVIAERRNANSPWTYTYFVGQGGTNVLMVIQTPINGSEGRFKTVFEAMPARVYKQLYAQIKELNADPKMHNTGALQLGKAPGGAGVNASIDNKPLYVPTLAELRDSLGF
jgi:hypothetical protein